MQVAGTAAAHEPDLLLAGPRVTYDTLLIKVMALLEHAAHVRARWVLKTDDDAYVNVPQLLQARRLQCCGCVCVVMPARQHAAAAAGFCLRLAVVSQTLRLYG